MRALAKLVERTDIFYTEEATLSEYFSAIDSVATALSKAMASGMTVDKGFNGAQKEAEAIFKRVEYHSCPN